VGPGSGEKVLDKRKNSDDCAGIRSPYRKAPRLVTLSYTVTYNGQQYMRHSKYSRVRLLRHTAECPHQLHVSACVSITAL
jgi:hypothetical protein